MDEPSRRPQSPASKGIRAGLLVALAAALLVLAANDSWLLPSLDEDGVAYLYAAGSLAAGGEARVPVAAWSAPDSVSGLGAGRSRLVPEAMAVLVRRGIRVHVAGLWVLAASLALLGLVAAWVAGGASSVEGGLVAGVLLLASPMAVEVGTALRPDALAAALTGLQLGLMTYRPRWHPAHGAAGALAWVAHPAGAGAVAVAAVWPFLPGKPPLGPRLPGPSRSWAGRAGAAGAALLPGVALLILGPSVAGLPSLPAVMGGGLSARPLAELVRWAGAGVPGIPGITLGLILLAGGATLALLEAVTTPPVDAHTPWDAPRAPDLVASRARAACWLLALGLALGAVVAVPGGGLARPGILPVVPVATLVALAVSRWIQRSPQWQRGVLSGLVGAWILLSGWTALGRAREIRTDGRGLTSAVFLESEAVQWLDNRLPTGWAIYASSPSMVLVQTGRAARSLPDGPEALDDFAVALVRRPGVVVLTGTDTARAETFQARLGFTPVVWEGPSWVLAPETPMGR